MSEFYQPELPDMPVEKTRPIAPKELHFRYVLDHLIEVELIEGDMRADIIDWWRDEHYGT